MKRLALLLLLLAVATVACHEENNRDRTGVRWVDEVVQTVLSGDQEALRGSVRYASMACTTVPLEFGGPPECLPGESDGTVIDVLRMASCEDHYVRPDGIDQELTYLLAAKPKLYGLYQGSPGTLLPGDYWAVFSVEGAEPGEVDGKALVIDPYGAIVFIDFGCNESPEQLAQRLEQQPSPTPAATPAADTGVPEVDAVVQAVLSGDQEALRGFVRYAAVACSTKSEIGVEPCRPDEPDGTVVDALYLADCEGYYVRPDDIDRSLSYLLARKPKLYGVYRASRAAASGDHVAIFSIEGPERGQVFGVELLIDDGAIVFIDFGCGASPEQLAQYLEQQPSPTPAATPAAGSGG